MPDGAVETPHKHAVVEAARLAFLRMHNKIAQPSSSAIISARAQGKAPVKSKMAVKLHGKGPPPVEPPPKPKLWREKPELCTKFQALLTDLGSLLQQEPNFKVSGSAAQPPSRLVR